MVNNFSESSAAEVRDKVVGESDEIGGVCPIRWIRTYAILLIVLGKPVGILQTFPKSQLTLAFAWAEFVKQSFNGSFPGFGGWIICF